MLDSLYQLIIGVLMSITAILSGLDKEKPYGKDINTDREVMCAI